MSTYIESPQKTVDADDIPKTGMTSDILKKLIAQHKKSLPRWAEQKAYAIGNNVSINLPRPKPSPDNRISIPYARSTVAFFKGYMGKPGNITYQGDYYETVLQPIFNENEEELITSNIMEDGFIHGRGYELHWTADSHKYFYPVPIENAICIYSDDLKPMLIGFIYWRCDADDNSETATYYDAQTMTDWTLDDQKDDWKQGPVKMHGYGQVPVNPLQIDRDGRNLFDHALNLIDAADKIISEDVANELERFAGALMLMKQKIGTIADEFGLSDVDKIKLTRIIDQLDSEGSVKDQVAFLVRDIPKDFIEFCFSQIERLYYEAVGFPNPNDDTFATASGIAQAYKLLGLEYRASSIEPYILRFLQNRIRLLAGITDSMAVSGSGVLRFLKKLVGKNANGVNDVVISMKRNLPFNLAETVDAVSKMGGRLPQESMMRLFPSDILGMSAAEAAKAVVAEAPKIPSIVTPITQTATTTAINK